MFPFLPEEIEYMIWKEYYNRNVLDQIEEQECIWLRYDVKRLITMCRKDKCYEVEHCDINRMKKSIIPKMRFVMLTRYRSLAMMNR